MAAPGGTSITGRVGGITPRVTAQYVRSADNTGAYAPGDMIGNSVTATSVVPITFANAIRYINGSARVTAASCVLSCASGTIVLPAFDLLVFRPYTDTPFAAGSYPADNAALNITSAAFNQLVGIFSFASTTWRNQAGGSTAAGDHIYQSSVLSTRYYAPVDVTDLNSTNLVAVMQAQSAWNPGNVAQTFDFVLDIDQD